MTGFLIKYGYEFLVCQLNNWSFYTIAFSLSLLFDRYTGCGHIGFLEWAAGGLVLFGMYLIRAYVEELWLSVMMHLAGVAVMLLVPFGNVSHSIIMGVCAVAYFIFSVRKHILHSIGDIAFPVYVTAGINFILLLILDYYECTEYTELFCMITVILAIVYFVQLYIFRFIIFRKMNSGSSGYFPVGDIFRSGLCMLAVFTGFLLLVLILSLQQEWTTAVFDFLRDALAIVMGIILSPFRLFKGESEEAAEEIRRPVAQEQAMPAVEEDSIISLIANYVITIAVLTVLAVIIIKGIIRLIRWIKANHRLGSKDNDGQITDVREKIVRHQKNAQRKDSLTGFAPEVRVRKIFRKKVLANRRKIIADLPDRYLGHHTSADCESRLETPGMAELYDKARYSDKQVTKDDVKNMKRICS